jgi:hypothetical protein
MNFRLQTRSAFLGVVFLTFVSFVAAIPASAGDALITFRKVFKGSMPEFEEIKIGEAGKCSYDIRQLAEDPDVRPLEVGQALRARIFSLADELGHFRNVDLDVHRRIANLGAKTFRYEKDGESHEVVFNYTTNPAASQLVEIFEGLSRQQDHLLTLERRLKYDRLGVNEALLDLKADYDNKLIPEPERLLPVLEQIANDTRIVEIARQRARALTAKIRGAK